MKNEFKIALDKFKEISYPKDEVNLIDYDLNADLNLSSTELVGLLSTYSDAQVPSEEIKLFESLRGDVETKLSFVPEEAKKIREYYGQLLQLVNMKINSI